jgi:succinylglutamate desuccinylase
LVLSSGLHGNETAPVEITDLLLRQLFRGKYRSAGGCW